MTVDEKLQTEVITTEQAIYCMNHQYNYEKYECDYCPYCLLCEEKGIEGKMIKMAIKALEENEQIKAQINRCFQEVTNNLKAKNDRDEQLLEYAERLQDECKDLQRRNEDLSKCVELWTEANRKTREAIKKAREEIDKADEDLDGYDPHALDTYIARVWEILDKYLGEAKDDKSDRDK